MSAVPSVMMSNFLLFILRYFKLTLIYISYKEFKNKTDYLNSTIYFKASTRHHCHKIFNKKKLILNFN